MNFINYNNVNIKIENNKYNVRDIFNLLEYDNYEEYFGDNEEIYYSLRTLKNIFNEYDKEKNLIKYLEDNILMDIFTFIDYNDYKLELGEWFADIWYPLSNKNDVLINNNLLYFIHNGCKNVNKIYNSVGYVHTPLDFRSIKKN